MAKKEAHGEIDWTTEFAAIGEFVVCFEHIVGTLRLQAAHIFHIRGLADDDSRLTGIVFGYNHMTVKPILECFVSMVNELLTKNKEAADTIEELRRFKKKFLEQIERRNEILHSTFWIGDGVDFQLFEGDYLPMLAIKDSPSKKGYGIKKTVTSIDQLKEDIKKLKALRKEFALLVPKIHALIEKRRSG
ncbi:MAG: hypothetical protein JNL40_16815 [Cyclobacteriaceae bacterium]|nr:hypothetical protein [Cyclobacteriaceae bacterium]